MPKLKTNRAAAKRFKLTSTKKVKRAKAFKSHILTKKSSKRKSNLATSTYVHSSQESKIKRLLGIG